MENYSDLGFVNIGSGEEITIRDLAFLIKNVIGYQGEIELDATKPDGTPRKLMDDSLINQLGWRPIISLSLGIEKLVKNLKFSV
jgi:GDP-L-fucose synthase